MLLLNKTAISIKSTFSLLKYYFNYDKLNMTYCKCIKFVQDHWRSKPIVTNTPTVANTPTAANNNGDQHTKSHQHMNIWSSSSFSTWDAPH